MIGVFMSALSRMLALSASAGLSTYLYNKAAEKGILGEAPHAHPSEPAALTVGLTTLFVAAVRKNPLFAIGAGMTSFTALAFYGDYQTTKIKRQWDLYDQKGVIPDRQTLELEIQRSDSSDNRKRQALELLGAIATRSYTIRSEF